MCRNMWHNRNNREARKRTSRVNNRLAANRKILENLYESGVRTISKDLLAEEKFDFNHYTSYSKGPLGKQTYRCYEFTYTSDLHHNLTIEKD